MSIRLNAYKNYNAGMVKTVSDRKSSLSAKKQSELSASKTDTISISANAAEYSAAKVQSAVSANVNSLSGADRVAQIKARVVSGEYGVSSEELAERILERFA